MSDKKGMDPKTYKFDTLSLHADINLIKMLVQDKYQYIKQLHIYLMM